MSFISDFLDYSQGTESPKNWRRWSALAALSCAAGRRYFLRQGRLEVRPGMNICLIGEQGMKKSFSKDISRDLITEAFPDYPLGAAMQSRENICELLCRPESARFYTDHENVKIQFTPLALYINELKNFLSFNPSGMIDFLTDIYDRRVFNASTVKRGLEEFPFPYITILACETPDWIVDKLKLKIISGGFSRRFIFIYEFEDPQNIIARPFLPKNHVLLWDRMKAKLKAIATNAREYKWTVEALGFFDNWYALTKAEVTRHSDHFMRGYFRNKDQQLLRVCILLDLAEEEPQYLITQELLEKGLAFFEVIEPNLPKLSNASGRNELAVPQQKLLDFMESQGGVLSEKKLLVATETEMSTAEQMSVIRYLESTDRLVRKSINWPPVGPDGKPGPLRVMIFLPFVYQRFVQSGEWQEVTKPKV